MGAKKNENGGVDGVSDKGSVGKSKNTIEKPEKTRKKKGGRQVVKHKAIDGDKRRSIYDRNRVKMILKYMVQRYRCTQKGGMVILCGCDGKIHMLKTPGFDEECQRHLDEHFTTGSGGMAVTSVEQLEATMDFQWDDEEMNRNPWNRQTITELVGNESKGFRFGATERIKNGSDLVKAACDDGDYDAGDFNEEEMRQMEEIFQDICY